MTPPVTPAVATHGKDGQIWMSTTGAGAPALVALLNKWSIDMATDTVETTAFGDRNKTYVQGLPDLKGTFAGLWNSEDDTIFDAAESPDGVKVIIVPSSLHDKNFSGPAWVNVSIEGGVNEAVTVKGTFTANGSWTRDVALPATAQQAAA